MRLVANIEYGTTFMKDGITLNIPKQKYEILDIVEFKYVNPVRIIEKLKRSINIDIQSSDSYFSRGDGLVQVSYNTNNPEFGKLLVDVSNKIYIEANLSYEKEKARKAISFIDNQITSVSSALIDSKNNLSDFKEANQSVNVDLEIQNIISNISSIEESINGIDLKLAEAKSLYTESNPAYINLETQKQKLLDQQNEIIFRIKDLPAAQQKYIDLSREVEASQELYSMLQDRKLSYSILEASTIGNIRILDAAYTDILISPRFNLVIFGIIFTALISLLVAVIRGEVLF